MSNIEHRVIIVKAWVLNIIKFYFTIRYWAFGIRY